MERERWLWVLGVLAALVAGFVLEADMEKHTVHAELSPTILALSPTKADTLDVFMAHGGCFDFVQTEAP